MMQKNGFLFLLLQDLKKDSVIKRDSFDKYQDIILLH